MELCSLHPVSDSLAKAYVQGLALSAVVSDQSADGGYAAESHGTPPHTSTIGDRQLQQITFELARFLAYHHPVFTTEGLSLTTWEARVDRGMAMLIRPPARLFTDAGLPESLARRMPIRLDLSEGMTGGGYIPARLIPQTRELIERNTKRSITRMIEAEMDYAFLHGLMTEAVDYALANGLGLYEAIGLVNYADPATWPSGARVRNQPTDRDVVARIALAAKPAPQPGILQSLLRKLSGS